MEEGKSKEQCNNFGTITPNISNKISYLSFAMCILVIFIHGGTIDYYICGRQKELFISQLVRFVGCTLGSLAVPVFFMISGFLFYHNINANENSSYLLIRNKLKRRMNSLLIPYLIWNSIMTLFYIIIPRISFLKQYFNNEAGKLTLWNVVRGVFFYGFNYPFWYLGWLLLFSVCAPIIFLLMKKKIMAFVEILALVIMIICKIEIPHFRTGALFFYSIGVIFGLHYKELFQKSISQKKRLVLWSIFVVIQILRFVLEMDSILYLVSPIILWFSVDVKKTATGFIKQSFFIYCSHVLIITTVFKLFFKFGGESASQIWILFSYFISPAITLSIIWMIYLIMAKRMPRLYAVITGNRSN